jgi:hypothetical protein
MLNEAFATYDDDVVSFFPHLVVLHYGIVEACPRRELRRLSGWSVPNYFNNSILGRSYVFASRRSKLVARLGWLGNAIVRNLAKPAGLNWQWLPTRKLCEVMEAAVKLALKETPAAVVVAGLSPCSERVRRLLPGTPELINEANQRLRELTAKFPKRVRFLDVDPFLPPEALAELVPDGVHFSARGHQLFSAQLDRIIDELGRTGELHPGALPLESVARH